MIQKGSKDVYTNVANKLELPYDDVSLIGNFIWNELAKKLENFEHREIYMIKLGNFRFRKKKSNEWIHFIRKCFEPGQNNYLTQNNKTIEDYQPKIDAMEKLIKEWDMIKEEKEKYKLKKEKYYADRDIQKQIGDLGRTEEPNI